MTRDYLMCWDERTGRWHKRTPTKYLSVAEAKITKVSCRQLGAPASKVASYKAANAWWLAKTAEWESKLTGAVESRFPRAVEDAETLEQMVAWLRAHGDEQAAESKAAIARRIRQSIDEGKQPFYTEREIFAISDWSGLSDEDFHARYISDVDVWADRLARSQPTPADKTVQNWIEAFVAVLRPKTKPQSLPNIERQLEEFSTWQGATASIDSIDEALVRTYYLKLQKNGKANSTNRDIWSTWKRWVNFLADEGQIERPRNLLNREFTFSVTTAPQAPELAEIRQFLRVLPGSRIRLYALLCLNCGMNNADIGQLHNTNYPWKRAQSLLEQGRTDCGHVDWRQGRIVRQRQKTKGKGKVPTVCYKLWQETFDLLREYRSKDDRYCLLTEMGTPLWKRDGIRKDAIYGREWKSLKSLSPKQLRAGGATLLGHHERFRLYVSQYLADSPRGIPDRHYVVPSQPQFDAAILWLGSQLKVRT